MPVAPTYPGVYIEEVPSGVRTITGVATSIAAFIDRFQRGPINTAVRVLSFADFEREFGGLDATSEASYAVRQFFINGGSEAVVVRVGSPPIAPAQLILSSQSTDVVRVTAGRQIHGLPVDNPGVWGNNLRVEVDYDTVSLPNTAIDPDAKMTPEELFNLTISEVGFQNGRMVVLRTEIYRNLTMRVGMRTNALEVINAGSQLVQLTGLAPAPDPLLRPRPTGTVGIPRTPSDTVPGPNATFLLTVDPDGSGGSAVDIEVTLKHSDTVTTFADLRPWVESAIRDEAVTADDVVIRQLLAGATVQFTGGGTYRVLLGRGVPISTRVRLRPSMVRPRRTSGWPAAPMSRLARRCSNPIRALRAPTPVY